MSNLPPGSLNDANAPWNQDEEWVEASVWCCFRNCHPLDDQYEETYEDTYSLRDRSEDSDLFLRDHEEYALEYAVDEAYNEKASHYKLLIDDDEWWDSREYANGNLNNRKFALPMGSLCQSSPDYWGFLLFETLGDIPDLTRLKPIAPILIPTSTLSTSTRAVPHILPVIKNIISEEMTISPSPYYNIWIGVMWDGDNVERMAYPHVMGGFDENWQTVHWDTWSKEDIVNIQE